MSTTVFVSSSTSFAGGLNKLNSLSDVATTSPAVGDALWYTGSHFVNGRIRDASRYPNATWALLSTYGQALQEAHIIGCAAEGVGAGGTGSVWGVGFYGSAFTNGNSRCGGVIGEGHVTLTGDAGSAIGIRGYATDTHAGGYNIGLYGEASSGSANYALYMAAGGVYSAVAQTWTLNGDITFSGAYSLNTPSLKAFSLAISADGTVTSGTVTLNLTNGNTHTLTQNGNITLALPTGLPTGENRIRLILAYTSGTLSLPLAGVAWEGGSPVLPSSTFAGTTFQYDFTTVNGGTNWTATFNGAY